MILKCKVCGGSLEIKGEKIMVCVHCGSIQSIPSHSDTKIQEIYNLANNYFRMYDFDKAENLYRKILCDNKEDADAYWNVLMCRYGVTYVKDPATGKYIPTCNRTLYNPIFNDEYYQNAIKYADETQKELYTSVAQTIDKIQKGIISVSKHEKPFDIFISYKETDLDGVRTQDSIVAQELYNKLVAEGYKVFFSRITLEDKAGTEYEPYIYAALASSKVMITVSSSRENLEAVWVKNEWSRFLSFAEENNEKILIPLRHNMDESNLPKEFTNLSSYDINENGFEQEFIRGIKKIIPQPVMLLDKKNKLRRKVKHFSIGVAVVAVIAMVFSIPWLAKIPKYNYAMRMYKEANYAEATWAFDELGSYRDADKMSEKCELSWRKSLANVVTYNYLGASSDIYGISSNGIVVNGYGGAHNELELNEHGKIISIGDNTKLYALREDGYVDNANQNIDVSEWNDVIQISPILDGTTNVALKYDGTFLFGENGWSNKLRTLKNIVTFETYNDVQQGGAMVIAKTSSGELCGVIDDTLNQYIGGDFDKILAQFEKVEQFDFSVDIFSNNSFEQSLNIAALTSDNKVITYLDGYFKEYSVKDIVDVRLVYDIYGGYIIHLLNTDGEIIELETNIPIISDIVYICKDFYISSSGEVYNSYYFDGELEITKENVKVAVYDEWIARMN